MTQKIDYKEDIERSTAVFDTNMGVFEVELYAAECPETVWNFINLTEGRQGTKKGGNFYDGLIFHRVIQGFIIQGGCPSGTGTGGPGYHYAGEYASHVRHNRPYLLSMANAGHGTDGSQFFLTFAPTPHLDGRHSIFGEVVDGQDVVKLLEKAGTLGGKPKEKLVILKATIDKKAKSL